MHLAGDTEVLDLCLGYIPKDLAYLVAPILDHAHIFMVTSLDYAQAKNRLTIEFGLTPNVLRDQRQR